MRTLIGGLPQAVADWMTERQVTYEGKLLAIPAPILKACVVAQPLHARHPIIDNAGDLIQKEVARPITRRGQRVGGFEQRGEISVAPAVTRSMNRFHEPAERRSAGRDSIAAHTRRLHGRAEGIVEGAEGNLLP
jgi:hypothetical protein